jgi:hypothetical protein
MDIYVLVDFFCGIDIGLWKTNVTRGERNNMVFKKAYNKIINDNFELIIMWDLTIFEFFSRF